MSTATIQVWYDAYSDDMPDRAPDVEEEIDIYEDDWLGQPPNSPPHDADTFLETEDVHNHRKYSLYVDVDEPVYFFVHTNDSVHDPTAWNRPVEGGLLYGPDVGAVSTFDCEMWGRVTMWVGARDVNGE